MDDEENIRLMLGKVLEHNGFAVTSVGSVPEALKFITEQALNCVFVHEEQNVIRRGCADL